MTLRLLARLASQAKDKVAEKSQYQLIAEFSVSLNGGNFAGKA